MSLLKRLGFFSDSIKNPQLVLIPIPLPPIKEIGDLNPLDYIRGLEKKQLFSSSEEGKKSIANKKETFPAEDVQMISFIKLNSD